MLAKVLCTDTDSPYDNKASFGLKFEGTSMASVCCTAHKGARQKERDVELEKGEGGNEDRAIPS